MQGCNDPHIRGQRTCQFAHHVASAEGETCDESADYFFGTTSCRGDRAAATQWKLAN
jgi:hypothetical protein